MGMWEACCWVHRPSAQGPPGAPCSPCLGTRQAPGREAGGGDQLVQQHPLDQAGQVPLLACNHMHCQAQAAAAVSIKRYRFTLNKQSNSNNLAVTGNQACNAQLQQQPVEEGPGHRTCQI